MKRRTIRGVGRDSIDVGFAPQPFEWRLARREGRQVWLTTHSGMLELTSALTLAGARRLHAALGEMLGRR